MEKNHKINLDDDEEDLGFLLWELQQYENFFPVYQTMIKKK
jgi:hypothetical protein